MIFSGKWCLILKEKSNLLQLEACERWPQQLFSFFLFSWVLHWKTIANWDNSFDLTFICLAWIIFALPLLKLLECLKLCREHFQSKKKNFSFLCLYNAFSDKVGLKSQAVILLKKFKFHTRRVKKESCNKLNSIKYICKLQIHQLLWVLFSNKLQLSSWLLNCPIQLRWKVLLVDLFTS